MTSAEHTGGAAPAIRGGRPDVEHKLLSLCDDVVARALRRGASGCEAFAEHATQTSASVEQNELKGASAAEHEAVGIRVLVAKPEGDACGFAYVNHLGADNLDAAIDDALAIARASGGDPANGLVRPRPAKLIPGLWDDAIATLSPESVVEETARLLERARARDRRVSVDNASFSASTGVNAIVSSAGIRLASSESAASWGISGMAVDRDAVTGFDSLYDATRRHADIDVDALADRFTDRILALLAPRAGRSYRGKALFSPEAFEEVFLEAVFEAIDGDAVLKGKSRLKDKLGKRVARSGFMLVDDGTVPGAVGSACFDREGLPHRRTVIIGDGVLHAFLYDGKAARRAGRQPTGHAGGPARQLPSIGTTNVAVGAGDASTADLLSELRDGLYVGRFSGEVDPVSGDFSGVAKASFLVKNGKKAWPVKETLIAGNVFDGLERLVAWGKERQRHVTTLCPEVLVDGIEVTAG